MVEVIKVLDVTSSAVEYIFSGIRSEASCLDGSRSAANQDASLLMPLKMSSKAEDDETSGSLQTLTMAYKNPHILNK